MARSLIVRLDERKALLPLPFRKALNTQDRFEKLRAVLIASNGFYRDRLMSAVRFEDIPFTSKSELLDDQSAFPPFGTNLTFPIQDYTRLHQTSGTSGHPLIWLDTAESWRWWMRC